MKSTQKKVSGADLPTPWHGFVFELKAWVLRLKRRFRNIRQGIKKYKPKQTLSGASVLSESRSLLWSGEETAQALIIGKIHNLRLAAKQLDGLVIPANQIFSFWKQVGRATRRRGYARGRELREGCIIPTIGGGLCQLSNAIYDAANLAGLEIVERHRHSRVIAGSLAEVGRDATIFWNYIDLCIRSPFSWQLRVKMDAKHLSVCISACNGEKSGNRPEVPAERLTPDAMGDCTQCGRTDCYLHVGNIPSSLHKTWLVTEEEWPEFALWRKQNAGEHDKVISTLPHDGKMPPLNTRIANFISKLKRRYHIRRKHPLPVAHNSRFSYIARHFMKKLDAGDTYLIVPQNLLPWLWMAGELRGRQYDVLMTALPVPEIQSLLDQAVKTYPKRTTLSDFRADEAFIEAEREALAGAGSWISPHTEILKRAGKKALPVPWIVPETEPESIRRSEKDKTESSVLKIMLAGPALARKGVYELYEVLRDFPVDSFQLLLPPGTSETPDLWQGFSVRRLSSLSEGIRQADVVVLPAWVEHNPRGLLQAMAMGKPVIASTVCGLPETGKWIPVQAGDTEKLKQAMAAVFQPRHSCYHRHT